jgi:hypothetical protein
LGDRWKPELFRPMAGNQERLSPSVPAGSAALPQERGPTFQSQYQGTPAQRASCRPNVYRLCAGEIPNVRAITACLRKNYSRLSEGCAALFADSQ